MEEGIKLAARFVYTPNSLGNCGPQNSYQKILSYLSGESPVDETKEALMKFQGLPHYLNFIAGKAGKDMFDPEVVEAYIIGNDLLKSFNHSDMKDLIEYLGTKGLPDTIKIPRLNNLPEGMVPHHNFHVLYIGIGSIAGKVEATLKNTDLCRVSVGRVVDVNSLEEMIVSVKPLVNDNGILKIGDYEEPKTAVYSKEFLPEPPRIGDYVALHWGRAFKKLSEEQAENIEKYTNKILEALSSSK